jgi:protein-tyrosine-phosphatase
MESKKILFVCTGNIYRSRLAEAYLRSKNLANVEVLSSGTQASIQHKGPMTWYSLRLMYRYGLLPFMAPSWRQTTEKDFNGVDVAIFMGKANYEYCQQNFSLPEKYEVWNLPDFDDRDLIGKPLNIEREIEGIKMSEEVFSQIKEKIDKLVLETII